MTPLSRANRSASTAESPAAIRPIANIAATRLLREARSNGDSAAGPPKSLARSEIRARNRRACFVAVDVAWVKVQQSSLDVRAFAKLAAIDA